MQCPSLDRRTVVILSSMTLHGVVRPLAWLGCKGIHNSGTSAVVVVSGQTVMESVASNRSSWTT